MPVELQELWETAVQFCEDNVIGAIIAGTLLLLLVALILLTARGRKRRKQEADKWMAGFEERMAAFERNENPMMPPRESILKSLRENRKARGDDETPADTTRTEAISRSAPEAEPETAEPEEAPLLPQAYSLILRIPEKLQARPRLLTVRTALLRKKVLFLLPVEAVLLRIILIPAWTIF